MNYRNIDDLNHCILQHLSILPRDFDLIVGIPRSGMFPANLLALYLNLPVTDLDSFRNGHIYQTGERGKTFNMTHIRKVLVVDDSAFFRRLITDLINSDGRFEVVGTANNGQEAIEQTIALKPDIVTMDFEMPVMDGFTLSQKVREIEKHKDLPIIAISTRVTKADLEKGRDSGFDHHLEKFNRDQVIKLVNDILMERRG